MGRHLFHILCPIECYHLSSPAEVILVRIEALVRLEKDVMPSVLRKVGQQRYLLLLSARRRC
jgi:hypothetical protein